MSFLGDFFSSPYVTTPKTEASQIELGYDIDCDAWDDESLPHSMSTPEDYAINDASTSIVSPEMPVDRALALREALRSRPWFRILCDAKLMVDEAVSTWSGRGRRLLGVVRKEKGRSEDRCDGCKEILEAILASDDRRQPRMHVSRLRMHARQPCPQDLDPDFSVLVEPYHDQNRLAWQRPLETQKSRPQAAQPAMQPSQAFAQPPQPAEDLTRTLLRFAEAMVRKTA